MVVGVNRNYFDLLMVLVFILVGIWIVVDIADEGDGNKVIDAGLTADPQFEICG
jgi:flagellar biogenesis protein FliO